MDNILDAIGNLLALGGILICAPTVFTRLMGSYFIAGFELKVWFLAGVGVLVTALLAKVQVLLLRQEQLNTYSGVTGNSPRGERTHGPGAVLEQGWHDPLGAPGAVPLPVR